MSSLEQWRSHLAWRPPPLSDVPQSPVLRREPARGRLSRRAFSARGSSALGSWVPTSRQRSDLRILSFLRGLLTQEPGGGASVFMQSTYQHRERPGPRPLSSLVGVGCPRLPLRISRLKKEGVYSVLVAGRPERYSLQAKHGIREVWAEREMGPNISPT